MLIPQRSQASKAKRMGLCQAVMHVKVAHEGNQFSSYGRKEMVMIQTARLLKTQQQHSEMHWTHATRCTFLVLLNLMLETKSHGYLQEDSQKSKVLHNVIIFHHLIVSFDTENFIINRTVWDYLDYSLNLEALSHKQYKEVVISSASHF